MTVSAAVRAYNPWPGAFSYLHREGKSPERTVFMKVRPVEDLEAASRRDTPGSIEVLTKKRFRVHCGSGAVEVERMQRAGKPAMTAAVYMQGRRLAAGDFFGGRENLEQ